jgi:hypothetical protein
VSRYVPISSRFDQILPEYRDGYRDTSVEENPMMDFSLGDDVLTFAKVVGLIHVYRVPKEPPFHGSLPVPTAILRTDVLANGVSCREEEKRDQKEESSVHRSRLPMAKSSEQLGRSPRSMLEETPRGTVGSPSFDCVPFPQPRLLRFATQLQVAVGQRKETKATTFIFISFPLISWTNSIEPFET